MGAGTLARPKKKQAAATGPAPRPTALTIKGNLDWRAWVERGAKHCRTDVSKLIDASLVSYLRDQGFVEEPPER
jgi:hypothetical protein